MRPNSVASKKLSVPDVSGMPGNRCPKRPDHGRVAPILNTNTATRSNVTVHGTEPGRHTMQRYDEITLNISWGPDEVEIPDSVWCVRSHRPRYARRARPDGLGWYT